MRYSIQYVDLSEYLLKESKSLDTIRREFTDIVETAKKYGFDEYADIDGYDLHRFLQIILEDHKLVTSREASIIALRDEVRLLTGESCETAQCVIDNALKCVKLLGVIKETFQGDILECFHRLRE